MAPRAYDRALADVICERIAQGRSLRDVCRDEGMPAASTFLLWCKTDDALAEHYARAMEARADVVFDEIFEIADDATNDWMERQNADGSTYEVLNAEHVQRSRLRIDTRKWALARMNAKKYGDKLQQEMSGGMTMRWLRDDEADD